jgi:ABC-type transporter MlaC component
VTKLNRISALLILIASLIHGCDSKNETVNQGREAVKEVVTQPFNTLNAAKDSVRQSEDKQKAALEEAEKENK